MALRAQESYRIWPALVTRDFFAIYTIIRKSTKTTRRLLRRRTTESAISDFRILSNGNSHPDISKSRIATVARKQKRSSNAFRVPRAISERTQSRVEKRNADKERTRVGSRKSRPSRLRLKTAPRRGHADVPGENRNCSSRTPSRRFERTFRETSSILCNTLYYSACQPHVPLTLL